ncbi:MAG: uracil phosphoribosyltransferase [Coriobacteriia bacterium]|nr:uracil phosphoribosyltransferase [Coriobacteriia bacterium]
MNTDRVTVMDHAMVKHKLSILRCKDTPSKLFAELVGELAMMEAYEATRDLPLEDIEIETPLAQTTAQQIEGKKLVIVPILRAGLGMVDGILELIPAARVGHLGMQRDEKTHKPIPYYAKLPTGSENRKILLVDPMLATGGSAIMAIEHLRKMGIKDITFLNLVASPEGIEALLSADPDVHIYTCAIDERLNEDAYIIPGLGDAGDRIFGTK